MKVLKSVLALGMFVIFGLSSLSAQESVKLQEVPQKIQVSDIPVKVKETLKKYANYTISKEATFTKKSNNSTIYTFKFTRGEFTQFVLIDQNGKVRGIKDQEGNNN